jgi:hypothetical protein
MDYRLDNAAVEALREYIALRLLQPNFANARSIRNALDRARLRQANRLFTEALSADAAVDAHALACLTSADIRKSRVFATKAPSSEGHS